MKAALLLFLPCFLLFTLGELHGAPFPKNAVISLQLPEKAAIGDYLKGKFVIRNTGSSTLQFALWEELNVEVKDAKGHSLPKRTRVVVAGFLAKPAELKPGETISEEFLLGEYVDLLAPGAYVISAWSGLGWDMDDVHPSPVATVRIEFHSPTPQYAAARVHQLWKAKEPPLDPYEVNSTLEHLLDPQYLPALSEEAIAGHPEACFGIASILGTEASETLLKLADSKDPQLAKAAAMALLRRLPVPPDGRSYCLNSLSRDIPEIIRQAWPHNLDAPLLDLAVRLLDTAQTAGLPGNAKYRSPEDYFGLANTSVISPAATMIAARGGPSQVPALMKATDGALRSGVEPRADDLSFSAGLPEPLPALIDAIDALREGGWIIERTHALVDTPELNGPAGHLAFYRQLADPKIPKPKDDQWNREIQEYLHDGSLVIRENALRALPRPLAKELTEMVAEALEDADYGVVIAACEVAGASGRKSFVPPLAQLVESVHKSDFPQPVREAATKAAVQLGGGAVLWEAWANVLPDKKSTFDAVGQLCRGTIDLPFTGNQGGNDYINRSQRFLMRDGWRAFLRQNHDLLERGRRVPPDDPSITRLLTGYFGKEPIISIHLQDGTEWPKIIGPDGYATPPILPGKGLAQHDFFYTGEQKNRRAYIVRKGEIVWSYDDPDGRGEISDACLLSNGNVLLAHQFAVKLISPDKKVLWKYDVPKGCEVHTAQMIGKEHVLFIQNGNPALLKVINILTGETKKEFPLPTAHPETPHFQFRHARLTPTGTILVAHMDADKVCEYDANGKELWSIRAMRPWGVAPLANGNILITESLQGVREVNRDGNTVWEFAMFEAPDYQMKHLQQAWRLPNGNTLFNVWINQWSEKMDKSNMPVQALEVTPDKKVVWALHSWKSPDLGPATTIQILDQPEAPENVTFGDIK